MKKNTKSKRAAADKRLVKKLLGLRVTWIDKEPHRSAHGVRAKRFGHRNSAMILGARQIWNEAIETIIHGKQFCWRIDFAAVFVAEGEPTYKEENRMVVMACMEDLLEPVALEIEALVSEHGDKISFFQFNVECLGDRQPVEADYQQFSIA